MISPLAGIRPPQHIEPLKPQSGGDGQGFQGAFSDALSALNGIQSAAHASMERFLNGEGEELHRVALEQQKASIAFDLFLQVRNKAVQAYQEVMRMQL